MNIHSAGAGLRRREEILRLVRETLVRSQEELSERLLSRGFVVAQPTLSRDLKDLGLAKTPAGYVLPGKPLPGGAEGDRRRSEVKLEKALAEFVLSVTRAGTLVVLRTPPAAAHPVAHALDEAALLGVAGTIAGDDTVFVATPGLATASRLTRRFLAAVSPSPSPSSPPSHRRPRL